MLVLGAPVIYPALLRLNLVEIVRVIDAGLSSLNDYTFSSSKSLLMLGYDAFDFNQHGFCLFTDTVIFLPTMSFVAAALKLWESPSL